ncbi:hypothetical protein JTE90_002709 [Oedothorax gibbosus]|uniref:Uncharacterized protein n=1 Tax=Oedothorax gibbosus TaxID=931172 RepID=A0AAV6VYW1_9ARAC|nr:hypothetical protein JTE90_002709 [Oedothorax gibbosus]
MLFHHTTEFGLRTENSGTTLLKMPKELRKLATTLPRMTKSCQELRILATTLPRMTKSCQELRILATTLPRMTKSGQRWRVFRGWEGSSPYPHPDFFNKKSYFLRKAKTLNKHFLAPSIFPPNSAFMEAFVSQAGLAVSPLKMKCVPHSRDL